MCVRIYCIHTVILLYVSCVAHQKYNKQTNNHITHTHTHTHTIHTDTHTTHRHTDRLEVSLSEEISTTAHSVPKDGQFQSLHSSNIN